MKRIISGVLSVILLFSLLSVAAFAYVAPAGTGNQLATLTALPDTSAGSGISLISVGLTADNTTDTSKDFYITADTDAAKAAKAEITNHYKYGLSALGISRISGGLDNLIDGYWESGDTVPNHTTPTNGFGSLGYRVYDGFLYNFKGETTTEKDANAASNGYIYEMLLTFNFGKIANLDSFGYYSQGDALNYLKAADIYVSDNGSDWTYVGYYDHETLRVADGGTFDTSRLITGDKLGADAGNKTGSTDKDFIALFDLPINTKGQFLRIASVGSVGANKTTTTWGDGLVASDGKWQHMNELLVYGSLTDEVGYVYNAEDTSEDAIILHGYQTAAGETANTTSIRLVYGLNVEDLAAYTKYGMNVTVGEQNTPVEGTAVYTSIQAALGNGEVKTITAQALGYNYIATLVLDNIPTTGTYTITVTSAVYNGETPTAGTSCTVTVTNGVVSVTVPATNA